MELTREMRFEMRAFAERAKKNTPIWCGPTTGEWTRERSAISYAHIRAASPDAVIELIDQLHSLVTLSDSHLEFLERTRRAGRSVPLTEQAISDALRGLR